MENIAPLATLIEAEYSGFKAFHDILSAEQDALNRREIDKLGAIAKAKAEKVILLKRLAENRNQFLAALGFRSGQSLAAWLAHAGHPDLAASWESVLAIVKESDYLNRLNGAMIETRLNWNQQALSVIQTAAHKQGTYGRDGHTSGMTSGRSLGKV